MAAALLCLSGCDSISGLPLISNADPVPVSADVPPSNMGSQTRALALMPSNRDIGVGKPIVVRGRSGAAGRGEAPVPESISGGPGDVTLNFAGADIRDVIATVLGETLKLNYVVDPEVSGPVTFNVSRPLTRDELLPTLEAVLNSRGATMVRSDGIIRVMPLRKEGKITAAAPVATRSGPTPIGERTEVFPLRYVAAADMQHLLEKVLPPGQVVVGDEGHHLLVVQGSTNELQIAEETVRIFDINQLSGMSMALLPLHNAEPAAVATEMRNIFAANPKEAGGDGAIRVMAIDRLNAVMVMTRSPQYLDQARAWVDRLDRGHDVNERRVYVYNLQYSKAAQVARNLQGLLSNVQIQVKSSDEGGEGLGGDSAASGAKPMAPPSSISGAAPQLQPQPQPQPQAQPVSAAGPASASTTNAANSGPDSEKAVRIVADEAHNALLISARPRDYDLIRQVLEGIDVAPMQVLIEVTIAEVDLNDTLNYGVEYFLHSGRAAGLLTTGASAAGITPSVPGFALSYLEGANPAVVLNALSAVTQTKVISTPRLLVLNNQTAQLQVGDVVPIITQSATSTVTSNPSIVNNVQYKETGVVLDVTPRVNAGGYVTIDINQSVSNVLNTTTSTIDSPTFQQRRLSSTISVKNGQSILLGGMIQQTDNRDSSGIPILNDIPGVGFLFGNRANTAARTELVMFMTPHVIANDQQNRDLTRSVGREFENALDSSTMTPVRVPPR